MANCVSSALCEYDVIDLSGLILSQRCGLDLGFRGEAQGQYSELGLGLRLRGQDPA